MGAILVGPGETHTTLQTAVEASTAGDTITVAPGAYDSCIFRFLDDSVGTAGNPITLRAATKWGCKITPSGAAHGIEIQDGCDYIIIDGFEVTGGTLDGIRCNADHYEIKNCWVHANGTTGIGCTAASNGLVENCISESNGTTDQHHGIYTSPATNVIRDNIVRNNTGFGIQAYDAGGVTATEIYNNISYGNTSGAVIVQGPGAAACSNKVNNNVLAVPAASANIPVSIRACNGCEVANNIILTGTAPPIEETSGGVAACTNQVFANNLVYQTGLADNTHGGTADPTTDLVTNGGFETAGTNGGTTHNVAVATRARATNVATIVTSAAHGLVSTNVATIVTMTDATYNATNVAVTRIDDTTFTYASTGDDELATADTAGRVRTDVFGSWAEYTEGTSTVSRDTTEEDAGSNCCLWTVDAGNDYTQISQAALMTVGRVYTLEFRAKASAACTIKLNAPARYFTLTDAYQTYRSTFVATATGLTLLNSTGCGGKTIRLDSVKLYKAYGPEVHSTDQNMFWPKAGSRVIDAGEPTYKPAADFWGVATGAEIQIGAIPYTKELYPRTMLADPFDAVKLNRRWWDWRRKQQLLK